MRSIVASMARSMRRVGLLGASAIARAYYGLLQLGNVAFEAGDILAQLPRAMPGLSPGDRRRSVSVPSGAYAAADFRQ
jgi:hypothetical protein